MKLTSIPRIKRLSLSVTKPRRRVIANRVFRNLMSGGPCRSAHFNKSAYADTLRHVKRISKSAKK